MKKIFLFIILALILNCSRNAAITSDTVIYSEKEMKTKIGDLKKDTIVTALEYRNHSWGVRESIKIKYGSLVGYISPKSAVINQDPESSVYKWGYRPDYKEFYNQKDKKRYKMGYEFVPPYGPNLKDLPKTKISLEELLSDTKLEE
jgi:hypothetical protein